MASSSAPLSGPTNPKPPAANPVAARLLSQEERNNDHDRSLQRSVPLHRQLCALDHGRSDPEPQRQGRVHGLQRRQSSDRTATARSTSADRIGGPLDGGPAQQVMGRVLGFGGAEARLRFYCMRQRREGAVSLLAWAADDGALG